MTTPAVVRATGAVQGDAGRPLLREQLQLRPRADGADGLELHPLPSELSFEKGLFVLVRAIQLLTSSQPGKVVVVGLGGPSGAGKSELARRLQQLTPVTTVSLHNFLSLPPSPTDNTPGTPSQGETVNFDDPANTDFDCLVGVLTALKQHQEAQSPVWDFKESRRSGWQHLKVGPSNVVLVEGIYALAPAVRPLLDISVSVSGGVHFDLIKRIQRDMGRTEQSPREIIQQIADTVFPMYKLHVEPSLSSSSIRIRNTFNPFAGLVKNATYTLKSDHPDRVTVDRAARYLATGSCDDEHPDAGIDIDAVVSRETEHTADLYLMPPGEDAETCRDWIRMRQRDGRYSLSFEEFVTDGDVLISPHLSFDVPVRTLSGLMALGYSLGAIIKRETLVLRRRQQQPTTDATSAALCGLTVKFDTILQLGSRYAQVEGPVRATVEAAGTALGLDGTYLPRSFIELVQISRLLAECPPKLDDFLPSSVSSHRPSPVDLDAITTAATLQQQQQGPPTTPPTRGPAPRTSKPVGGHAAAGGGGCGAAPADSPGGTSLYTRPGWSTAPAPRPNQVTAASTPSARRLLRLDDTAENEASPPVAAGEGIAVSRHALPVVLHSDDGSNSARATPAVERSSLVARQLSALEEAVMALELRVGADKRPPSVSLPSTTLALALATGVALGAACASIWSRSSRR